MPLFFIISGILFRKDKISDFCSLVRHKVLTLLLPYLFFLLCTIVYKAVWNFDIGFELMFGNGVGALWFLYILFFTEIINAIFISKLTNQQYFCVALVLSLIGYLFYIYDIHFVYKIEVCCLATLFFCIGYTFKYYVFNIKIESVAILFLMFISSFLLSLLIPRLDMNHNQYGSYLPNILAAIGGTLVVVVVSKKIESLNITNVFRKFLIWAGKNSIVIVGLSQVINMSLKYCLSYTQLPRIVSMPIQHILLWLSLMLFSYLLNKYAPILIGKKR